MVHIFMTSASENIHTRAALDEGSGFELRANVTNFSKNQRAKANVTNTIHTI